MNIGERLGIILRDKKMQKKTLAARIGVPQTTLNSWVNRGSDFPSSFIIPLSKALEVSPLYLLTGEDSPDVAIPDDYVRLTPDEQFLLDTVRKLDHFGMVVVTNKAVEELRRALSEQGNEGKSIG